MYRVELTAGAGSTSTLQGVRNAEGDYEMSLRSARALVRKMSSFGLSAVITDDDTEERV